MPLRLTSILLIAISLAWGCSEPKQPAAAGSGGPPGAADVAGAPPAPALPPPVAAYPAVEWTVPAGGLPEGPPVADVIEIGDLKGIGLGGRQYVHLFDGCRDRYLMPEIGYSDPPSQFGSLLYGQFDPATGKPVGEPTVLGGEYIGMYGFYRGRGREVDVSPSGVLAIEILSTPENPSRISVVPTATEPRVLTDMPINVRWFAWTASNRLLVLNEGKLELWEGGQQPALVFGEKLELPIVMSPARNWVVATVDKKYFEIFDSQTGEVRGRIGPEGKWKQLAVSHDGKQLAAVRHAGPMPDNSSSNPADRYDIHIWDLATGKPTDYLMGDVISGGSPIYWAGPRHVFYNQRVYDLDSKLAVVTLGLPQLGAPQGEFGVQSSNVTVPTGSPDGRRWWTGNLGQAFAASIPLEPPGGKPAFDKKVAVNLDVRGDDAKRNAEVTSAITKALTAGGYKISDSPWIVRISSKVEVSGIQIYDKQETFVPPAVRCELKLIAPDGTEMLTIPFGGEFSPDNTAFLVRTTKNDPLQPMTTIYDFDFRGQDARTAILQECWDKTLKTLESIKSLPIVWEGNGKYQPIPVQVNLQPPPGVPRPPMEITKPKA